MPGVNDDLIRFGVKVQLEATRQKTGKGLGVPISGFSDTCYNKASVL